MIYQYSKSTNSLTQKAGMTEPNQPYYRYHEDYEEDFEKWNDHIASLKSYPCIKDKKWVDKKEYAENEFEIISDEMRIFGNAPKFQHFARLKEPIESQEDLWDLMRKDIAYEIEEDEEILTELINYWKTKFSITRK